MTTTTASSSHRITRMSEVTQAPTPTSTARRIAVVPVANACQPMRSSIVGSGSSSDDSSHRPTNAGTSAP